MQEKKVVLFPVFLLTLPQQQQFTQAVAGQPSSFQFTPVSSSFSASQSQPHRAHQGCQQEPCGGPKGQRTYSQGSPLSFQDLPQFFPSVLLDLRLVSASFSSLWAETKCSFVLSLLQHLCNLILYIKLPFLKYLAWFLFTNYILTATRDLYNKTTQKFPPH